MDASLTDGVAAPPNPFENRVQNGSIGSGARACRAVLFAIVLGMRDESERTFSELSRIAWRSEVDALKIERPGVH